MNRQERIKEGLTGKKTYINPETGEKTVIDFDDPDSGSTFTMKEWLLFTEKQIKANQKNFSGFTKEEEKLYSQIHLEDRDDSI
jgi:hypothetical protein